MSCQKKPAWGGMMQSASSSSPFTPSIQSVLEKLGIAHSPSSRLVESLPFSLYDTTAGTESELQVAVKGDRDTVDLPVTIAQSNTYAHILKRVSAGDTSREVVSHLEHYLSQNAEGIWENSWVRFPERFLSPPARRIFQDDLLSDKRNLHSAFRSDAARFLVCEGGERLLRIPISYLLKLALADAVGRQKSLPDSLRQTGLRLMAHFLNDNTSPETFSFHPVSLSPESGMGRAVARETSRRFLLTQLLIQYANEQFELQARGQEALVYCAPHPPIRQKLLNDAISDSFYRELFMSPCLSGWDRGEEKHGYMCLCHQVLSRSQLNAVAKLREAGIITRNLVVLPNLSNISLANNGTHLSLGSRKLTRALTDAASGMTPADEKVLGDLVIKIVEHFLPLFVGTYSGAPFRLEFTDFHPERALGFLPHELDYTHLRMIWRRWKKKAELRFFGCAVTPFGPEWIDRVLAVLLRLRGDFVPDFRLIDYFAALMSTERSPALDGRLGSGDRLKADLAEMGVFDTRMALYMLYRLREHHKMGFSGFEGRHFSLFDSLLEDLGEAANLQVLVTALAFKLIAEGRIAHEDIPDTPSVESERRQIFFAGAIGIPTFYVRRDTPNQLLKEVMARTEKVRMSRRYPGYLRVPIAEYRTSLCRFLMNEGGDLVESLHLDASVEDLLARLANPSELSAVGRLERGILDELGARSPMQVKAPEFNAAAERFYRNGLRRRQMSEALDLLADDLGSLERASDLGEAACRPLFARVLGDVPASEFLRRMRGAILSETLTSDVLLKLIDLVLITVLHDQESEQKKEKTVSHDRPFPPTEAPSIRRAANG